MAGRWHDHQSLVWLRPVAVTAAGLMTVFAGPSEAAEDPRGAQLLAMADDFLKGGDPLAPVRARSGTVDDTFAATGNHPFRIADLAGDGSAAFVATGKASVSPDTLTLVPAQGVWLKLDAVIRRFGEAKRSPALPGGERRFRIVIDDDRSVVLELSGDPGRTTARVTKLTAIRER